MRYRFWGELVAIGLCAGSLWNAAPAQAAGTDPLIEGAKLCTRHLARYERQYGIPTHLLSAISSTESGRYHEGLKIRIPWPWTINVEGKGYYFASKQEAINAVRQHQQRGAKSIDIGCMQVNLLHHPQAFSSLEQAFEPENNITYAASFLRSLYEETKSWKSAAADYHSRTPSRGNQYVGQVYSSWYQIIDKLRAARIQVPASTLTAMNEPVRAAQPVQPVKAVAVAAPKPLPEQMGRKLPAHARPHMKVIQVGSSASTEDTTREKGIIVVRPDIKVVDAPVVTVAQARPTAIPKVVTDTKITPVNSTATVSARKSGPNFIFND